LRPVARVSVVLAFLLSCQTAHEPPAPPLGVSLSEPRDDVTVGTITRPALHITRVDDCTIPPYLPMDAGGPPVITDIPYGDDDHQKYDLALPEGYPKALVVLIHGGGWTAGSKSLFRPTIRSLATVGYAAATVEYRLARDIQRAFPVGLSDVRCAVRAARLRVGVSKLVLVGGSAGGHLAALISEGADDGEACDDRTSITVDGAVLFYAPLAIDQARERYIPKMRQAVDELLYGARAFADGAIDESSRDWEARARRATPGHFVTRDTAPTLLLHGGRDTIVPIEDAREYAATLERSGVPALLVEAPDQNHGFPVLGRSPELRAASCSMLHFLEQISAR
jgi:acetyl esterase/lipase